MLSDCDEKSQHNRSTQYSYSSLPDTTIRRKNNNCPELELNNDVTKDLLEKVEVLKLKLKSTENKLDKQFADN